jgi:hypothetical protein
LKILILALLALSARGAAGAELRIGGTELAAMIQTAFRGTAIRLHHDEGGKPASFIRLGPRLRGETMTFSIPATEIRLGFGATARYEIDDVNSLPASTSAKEAVDSIAVSATDDTFIVTIHFEDGGTEIRGAPGGRLARFREGAVPDLQVDDIAVRILLTPQPGRIGFQPSRVFFSGNVQARGTLVPFFGRRIDVLDEVTDYKTTVKAAIEREVKKLVDRNLPAVATSIQNEVRRRTNGSGLTVQAVRFEGTTLTITGSVAE